MAGGDAPRAPEVAVLAIEGATTDREGVIVAAVDVGANSAHLLVARVSDGELTPLADESVLLGLGATVDAETRVPDELAARLAAALAAYVSRAGLLGARQTVLVGTEPFRRAANAARVVERVMAVVGEPLNVLDPEEEGLLTLLGVTRGVAPAHDIIVVDVGGGSTEVVVAGPGRRPVARGLPIGSARASAAFVEHDPPLRPEVEAIREQARRVLAAAPDARPATLVIVGGTASNLAKLDADAAADATLTLERLARIHERLLAVPAAEISARHDVNLQRARMLAAGAAIVEATLERYGLARAAATDAGIREGTVLAAARAGRAWRDAIRRLAAGGNDDRG